MIKKNKVGHPQKYNEPTTTKAFRIPISKVEEVTKLVKDKLETYAKNPSI